MVAKFELCVPHFDKDAKAHRYPLLPPLKPSDLDNSNVLLAQNMCWVLDTYH